MSCQDKVSTYQHLLNKVQNIYGSKVEGNGHISDATNRIDVENY